MKHKHAFLLAFAMSIYIQGFAQVTIKKIKDPHIRAQQDRMVVTKWGDFLPRPRNIFGVNVNYHYTMTWSWGAPAQNRRYRSGADIRPLAPAGQQTQRMSLNTVLLSTSNRYREHSDSLARTALSELYHHSGLFSGVDPLWQLYYKKELHGVTEHSLHNATYGLEPREQAYLAETGITDWFNGEMERLKERLAGAFNSDMDRGTRVLSYHRILLQYRKIRNLWESHTNWAGTLMELRELSRAGKSDSPMEFAVRHSQSDVLLMRRIIEDAKRLY